jgi:hypothetical protein
MGPGNFVSAPETTILVPMPAGTARNLRMRLNGAPAGVANYMFTLRNATGVGNTAVTCTIAGADTECSDVFNSATFAAGDTMSIRVDPSVAPAPTARIAMWTLMYEAGVTVLTGGSNGALLLGAGNTQFMGPGNFVSGAEANVVLPVRAGNVSNLRVLANGVVTAGSYTFTVRKNGVDTAVTCTMNNTACSDTVNRVAFAAGDNLNIMVTSVGGTTARAVGFSLMLGP